MKSCILLFLPVALMMTGCATATMLDGRSSTARSSNRLETLPGPARRCFHANWDERQYSDSGTNGWFYVECYPDGTLLDMLEDLGMDSPQYRAAPMRQEFNFLGRELPRDRAPDLGRVIGSRSCGSAASRIVHSWFLLAQDYSFDMYYNLVDSTNVIAGVWASDRKLGIIDKMAFKVYLSCDGEPIVYEVMSNRGSHGSAT